MQELMGDMIFPGGTINPPAPCLSNTIGTCSFGTTSTLTMALVTKCVDSFPGPCATETATYTTEFVLDRVSAGYWRYRTTVSGTDYDTEVWYADCGGGQYRWIFQINQRHQPGINLGNPLPYSPCTGTVPNFCYVASGASRITGTCTLDPLTIDKSNVPYDDPCQALSPLSECCIAFVAVDVTVNNCSEQTDRGCAGFYSYYLAELAMP